MNAIIIIEMEFLFLSIIQKVIVCYGMDFLLVLGDIGNSFVILIFDQHRKSACSVYLSSAAIINIIYLSFNIPIMFQTYIFGEPTSSSLVFYKSILTILFVPEAAYGPTNQCIGIGAVLRNRDHRIVFATESSWKGELSDFGFEEYMVDYSEQSATNEVIDAGQFWSNYIRMIKSEVHVRSLESSVRETSFRQRPNDCAPIYLSLRSLGGAEVELMQRLIDVLLHTPHRYIISKGPLHEQIKLAQRMDELGFGIRLSPYAFRDEELTDDINQILINKILREHMTEIGKRIHFHNGLQRAANIIETIVRQHSVQ
ncbi:unnamed protein product [Rotaria socialis]|uniref:Uncharacterized protein n=1 Tax=Rotaria socialis TaxID=392032 RepID=A0A821BF20_9BILA|nr:unnamed protein product [Rotaria socialis]